MEGHLTMHDVSSEITVKAPLEQVYNQWTQFEEFPQFMESVKEVRQLDDRRLSWRAEVLGKELEWDALIDEQVPDQRIEWHATSGREQRGVVRFEAWDMGETKVQLEMHYDLDGPAETIANSVGLLRREIGNDLERFKKFIEARAAETGAWRGTIADPAALDERALAEERQRRPDDAPDAAAAPGGTPIVDERTGEPGPG